MFRLNLVHSSLESVFGDITMELLVLHKLEFHSENPWKILDTLPCLIKIYMMHTASLCHTADCMHTVSLCHTADCMHTVSLCHTDHCVHTVSLCHTADCVHTASLCHTDDCVYCQFVSH